MICAACSKDVDVVYTPGRCTSSQSCSREESCWTRCCREEATMKETPVAALCSCCVALSTSMQSRLQLQNTCAQTPSILCAVQRYHWQR